MNCHMKKPTIFHVTHWKAGSQWVRAVLKSAAPERIVAGKESRDWFFNQPIVRGGIYTPVYATYERFRQVVPAGNDERTFVVIRDPRDSAVSWYFSLLHSHPANYPSVIDARPKLQQRDKREGMTLIMEDHMRALIDIQRNWIDSGARIFRYEDLLQDQIGVFGQIFAHCGIELSPRRVRMIVRRHSFRLRTFWRFGRENIKSHFRKGIAGDWRNHFDDELKDRFKKLYGDALIRAGYEKNLEW
jgi:hypothetical protein